jgi:hypothetical protein
MKIIFTGILIVVVGLMVCAGAQSNVAKRILPSPNSRHETRDRPGERRIHLEPLQESEPIEVSGSGGCVTFLTEVRFNVPFLLGRSGESVLAAGTSWPLPPGRYRLDNPTDAPVELLLNTRGACQEVTRR